MYTTGVTSVFIYPAVPLRVPLKQMKFHQNLYCHHLKVSNLILIHIPACFLVGGGCSAERFVTEVKVMDQCCDLLTVSDKTPLLSPYV